MTAQPAAPAPRLPIAMPASSRDTASATPPGRTRVSYLSVLTWSFALFSSMRLLAYLPTIAAIAVSGDSNQHSLFTWGTWLGSNATMAAWLYEGNGQRLNRAALVCAGNAAMCLVTIVVIVWHRL